MTGRMSIRPMQARTTPMTTRNDRDYADDNAGPTRTRIMAMAVVGGALTLS